jgi:hypothetical protein
LPVAATPPDSLTLPGSPLIGLNLFFRASTSS